MRIAVIDLGTNTFNLLIADLKEDKSYVIVHKSKIAVQLGESTINKDLLSPIAIERGIQALVEHQKIIQQHKVKKTYSVATSAIRSAKNGTEFIKKVKEKTGLNIQVVSGDKEAELIYHGVKMALDIGKEPALILDIGGGSNEFIIANSKHILWKQSLNIGVARLHEKFSPSDPITEEEIKRIEDHLSVTLFSLFYAVDKFPVKELIGSSGSFDTFAELIVNQFYNPEIIKDKTEYHYKLEDFKTIYQQLLLSTKEERLEMKGMIAMRADLIIIAGILVNFILTKFELSKMRLSTYSLKQGVLWKLMEQGKI